MNFQKTLKKSAKILLLLGGFIALFHSILSNEKPIVAKIDNEWVFPALREFGNDLGIASMPSGMQGYNYEGATFSIYPFNRYSYDFLNREGLSYAPPLTMGPNGRHLLGTDKLGRDVLAGVFRGFYIAFKIGVISLLFSSLMGVLLGLMMGYYGDQRLKWNLYEILVVVVGTIILVFYLVHPLQSVTYSVFFWVILLLAIIGLKRIASTLSIKKHEIPFDLFFMKVIELFKSLPSLILLLAVLPLFPFKGAVNIIIVLVLISWRNFARHVRAETYAIKEKEYIQSAHSQGQSDWTIMVKQILPNVLPTVLVLASFSFAGLVLLESSLSFLGFGLPIGEVSWGSLLAEGRINTSAWWLSVFPGLCIFVVLLSINVFVDRKIALNEE